MKSDNDNDKYNVKVVERCFAILDLAAASDNPLTVQQVMNTLGINTNMAYRLLTTMVSSGYLNKNETTSSYTVSMKVSRLFRQALASVEIRKVALPYMEMLWKQFPKANVNLGVLYDGEVLQTDRIDSQTVPRTYFTPGKTIPLHASGMGKVLASELPESQLKQLFDIKGGLKGITPHTITTYDGILKELAKVRKQGYATDREELILSDNCNAAPIRNAKGEIVGAVSMSAFDNFIPVTEMDENIHCICETARQISYFLGYQP